MADNANTHAAPLHHLRWLRRLLVGRAPLEYWDTPLSRRAVTHIARAMGDFLAQHLDALIRRRIEVSDDGNTRRVTVLGSFVYAYDRQQREAWAENIDWDGEWDRFAPIPQATQVAFCTPLCTAYWREVVRKNLWSASHDWLQAHVAGVFHAVDGRAFKQLFWRAWTRSMPRARLGKTLRGIATKRLRADIRAALALDPELVALARESGLGRNPICQHRLTFVWQSATLLDRIRAQTPKLLAPVTEYLLQHGMDASKDPTRRFKDWLKDEGIRRATFQLLAQRGERAFRSVVRHWKGNHALNALVLALTLAQRPNGALPLPARLGKSMFDTFDGSRTPKGWLDDVRQLPPRFLDIVRSAADRACARGMLDDFLHEELGLVLAWWYERPKALDRLKGEGWACWLAAAKAHHARQRAKVAGAPWTSAMNAWHGEDATATALVSPLMLYDEGTSLHHCVYKLIGSCHQGTQRFFSARLRRGDREERATVGLLRNEKGWRVFDVRGICNRPMDAAWWKLARRLAQDYSACASAGAPTAAAANDPAPATLAPSTLRQPIVTGAAGATA